MATAPHIHTFPAALSQPLKHHEYNENGTMLLKNVYVGLSILRFLFRPFVVVAGAGADAAGALRRCIGVAMVRRVCPFHVHTYV